MIIDLGGKYENTTRQKANSRYLDSETRQKAYKEWLQTNSTSKQNRNLRSHIEQAQKKIGEVRYLPSNPTKDNSTFYISANEVSIMDKYKERYFVYRVYNLKTRNPEVYILDYNEFKNKITLEIDSYIGILKGEY